MTSQLTPGDIAAIAAEVHKLQQAALSPASPSESDKGTITSGSGGAQASSGTQGLERTFKGSGYQRGNLGGTTTGFARYAKMHVYERGIHQMSGVQMGKWATGDTALYYDYLAASAGTTAPSDEGVAGCTLEIGEVDYLRAHVVSSSGVGDLHPVLVANLPGEHGWTVNGGTLLNTARGFHAGNLTGASKPFGTFLNTLPTDIALPLTSTYGIATASIDTPIRTADSPIAVDVTVTVEAVQGVVRPFVAGGVVAVASINMPEQAAILAVTPIVNGQQTLTLMLRNASREAVIFQGGLTGYYLSFDKNYMASAHYVFGSLDGASLIYGVNVCGNLAGNTLPRTGDEVAAISGPEAAFHIFPGAEIVKTDDASLAVTLEANAALFLAGDTVMVCAGAHFSGHGDAVYWEQNTPSNRSNLSAGRLTVLRGEGITGGAVAHRTLNYSDARQYRCYGGPLTEPTMNYTEGIFGLHDFHYYTPGVGIAGAEPTVRLWVNYANPYLKVQPRIVIENFASGHGLFLFDPANNRFVFESGGAHCGLSVQGQAEASGYTANGKRGFTGSAKAGQTLLIEGGIVVGVA